MEYITLLNNKKMPKLWTEDVNQLTELPDFKRPEVANAMVQAFVAAALLCQFASGSSLLYFGFAILLITILAKRGDVTTIITLNPPSPFHKTQPPTPTPPATLATQFQSFAKANANADTADTRAQPTRLESLYGVTDPSGLRGITGTPVQRQSHPLVGRRGRLL